MQTEPSSPAVDEAVSPAEAVHRKGVVHHARAGEFLIAEPLPEGHHLDARRKAVVAAESGRHAVVVVFDGRVAGIAVHRRVPDENRFETARLIASRKRRVAVDVGRTFIGLSTFSVGRLEVVLEGMHGTGLPPVRAACVRAMRRLNGPAPSHRARPH